MKLTDIEKFNKTSIFESISPGDVYFRTWEKEIHPVLCEVAISPDKIQQLFKSIETDAGRSILGKGVDAVKGTANKISDAWFNKFGGMLQSSGPVQAFDQKWEDIKSKIGAKNPELAAKLAKYGQFAKNNPNLHKFLLAIASSAAAALGVAVAGGVGAGALAVGTGTGVAVGILNIADRLLQGQKASTSIGRGATTGAIAGVTAGVMTKLGGWLQGFREKSIPIGPKDAGLERISWDASKTLSEPGLEWTQRTQGFQALVRNSEAMEINAAMRAIKNGEPGGFDELWSIAKLVNSKDYISLVQAQVDTAWNVAKSNDSILQFIKAIQQAAPAVAGGVASAATNQQPKESLSKHQINELFGFTGNKIDSATLEKEWEKLGKPTDSDEILKILQKYKVNKEIINQAFKKIGINIPPTPTPAPTTPTTPTPAPTTPPTPTPAPTTPTTPTPAPTTPTTPAPQISKKLTPIVDKFKLLSNEQQLKIIKSLSNIIKKDRAKQIKKQQPTQPQPNPFGSMVNQLSSKTSSTGGKITATPTGIRHTAKQQNPAPVTAQTQQPVPQYPTNPFGGMVGNLTQK